MSIDRVFWSGVLTVGVALLVSILANVVAEWWRK